MIKLVETDKTKLKTHVNLAPYHQNWKIKNIYILDLYFMCMYFHA